MVLSLTFCAGNQEGGFYTNVKGKSFGKGPSITKLISSATDSFHIFLLYSL